MTEDELEAGIFPALTIAGWVWTHVRDSRGVTQGASGLPDIIAVHPIREVVLLWELKGENGVMSRDQWAWLGPLARIAGIIDAAMIAAGGIYPREKAPMIFDARIITPATYDQALAFIVGKVDRWPG